MTTLSPEDTIRQDTDDLDLKDLNPVVDVMEKAWQRLLTQSAWQPQQLLFRMLLQEQVRTLRRGLCGGR